MPNGTNKQKSQIQRFDYQFVRIHDSTKQKAVLTKFLI